MLSSAAASRLDAQFIPGSFVPLKITFSSGFAFAVNEVWIAIFGQLNKVNGDARTLIGNFYLDATHVQDDPSGPTPQLTDLLPSPGAGTPDQIILPSFTLDDWGSNLKLPIPESGMEYTGRIVISVGAPAQCQVINADHTVAAPAASNSADPSTGTFYDFLEFTVAPGSDSTNNVDIDTSQVDSFCLPMSVQLNGSFNSGGGPVGVEESRSALFADFSKFVAAGDATPFAVCAKASPLRLIAPKAIVESGR
jgi:hypothetical protein